VSEKSENLFSTMQRLVALHLWELGAIKIDLNTPFKLVSGNYSPIYVNCREVISSVVFADLFSAATRLLCATRQIQYDILAGGETAGIPLAAFLSRSFGVPMVYVRKGAKEHGIASKVEGGNVNDRRVLLIEDLITDAGSKIGFANALRKAGATITDVVVIFDRLQGGEAVLQKHGMCLHAITNMTVALAEAKAVGWIRSDQVTAVGEYLSSPEEWHRVRSLEFHS
jgi:orotate phosphoribosyltransferase